MRLINADALKLAIVEEGQKSKRYKIGEFWELNRDEIWNAIDAQPTIEERKKGKWVERSHWLNKHVEEWQSTRCSVCGKYHITPYLYFFDSFNYCPNCGADMRGDEGSNAVQNHSLP